MIHKDNNTLKFIADNFQTDTNKLLLNAKKYPDLDIPYIVDQINSRKAIRNKLPVWFENVNIIYPSRISTEQCSSQLTASYKSEIIPFNTLCDLTGGMGVDSFYFSKKAGKVIYVERFEDYCISAKHNFDSLGVENIEVINSDSRDIIEQIEDVDTFYIDPARRSDANKRIFAINECEPDVLAIKGKLLSKAKNLIIKVSPMADIAFSLSLLPETTQVHTVSVKNECKELIFVLNNSKNNDEDIKITCVNFDSSNNKSVFTYNIKEENDSSPKYSNKIMHYLYEPNSSVMKAGAFKIISERFDIFKLGINTHLYTSDNLIENFPGRIFTVESVENFTSSTLKSLKKSVPKANITIRNFLISVDEIRKKSSIKEGGDIYLFFTTISKDERIIVKCSKYK